ncbi:MAG: hypothetical protein ABI171_05140 [Collimonas sp.]|uniref:hypothetical protein n=1 Tax=Collimonas sp. TaxID=1963772 RepID=UPI003265AE5D
MPKLISAACIEMWNAANLSFALCPMLTDGAIEALLTLPQARALAVTIKNACELDLFVLSEEHF